MPLNFRHLLKTRAGRDLLMVAIIALLSSATAVWFDLNDRLIEFAHNASIEVLDELPTVMTAIAVVLVWFSYRRWRESRAEVNAHLAAIDALQTSERQLRNSEERLDRAQRIAEIGSWERDLLTDQLAWSNELYRMLGLSAATFVPTRDEVNRRTHEEDRARVAAWLEELKAGRSPTAIELRVTCADGERRILRSEGMPIRDSFGSPIKISGTVQDVTRTRHLEEERNQLYAQLLQSQKLEALGTLSGGIAHDLNNTLVPVIALAPLLMRRFEPGSRDYVNAQLILQSGERARDLVRQILQFARKSKSDRAPVQLAELVAETSKMMRASLPSTITIEAHIEPVPKIRANATQLHQVLINLISNAAQAIGSRMGRIRVSLGMEADGKPRLDGRSVQLSVIDDGCGMDPATLRRVFEPFFTTKEVGRGTGLGLAVVHGIVSGHGGIIEVASEPGIGTRFDLFFPSGHAEAEVSEGSSVAELSIAS